MRFSYYVIHVLFVTLFFVSCSDKELTQEEVSGIWFLKEMEGEEAAYIFGGGLPTINFDWNDKQIFGTGGCNRYTLNYKLEGKKIEFNSLIATEVACENLETEQKFFSLLSKATTIEVEDGALLLKRDKTVLLRFLKLDLSAEAANK